MACRDARSISNSSHVGGSESAHRHIHISVNHIYLTGVNNNRRLTRTPSQTDAS